MLVYNSVAFSGKKMSVLTQLHTPALLSFLETGLNLAPGVYWVLPLEHGHAWGYWIRECWAICKRVQVEVWQGIQAKVP